MSVTATRPSHVKATAIGGAVVGAVGGIVGSAAGRRQLGTTVVSTGVGAALGAAYYGGIAYLSYHQGWKPVYLGAGAAGLAAVPVLIVGKSGSESRRVGKAALAGGVAGGIGFGVAYWNRPNDDEAVVVPVATPYDRVAADTQVVVRADNQRSVAGVFG